MRRVGVGGVLVAVLVSGCVPQAPVKPSPSAPTFMCTPEAGGVKAPCSEQQFQQMEAKDALYAEAEQVYRTYTAELMSLVRKGGSKSIPSSLQRLISGKELSDSVAQRLREVKEERLVFKGPDVRIVWAKRLPTRQKGGSVVAMKFCGDSSGLQVYKNGKKYGQGVTSEETAFFNGQPGAITMMAVEYEDVKKC